MNSLFQTDGYKLFHGDAYDKDIVKVYSNLTARSNHHSNIKNNDKVVSLGYQYLIKNLLQEDFCDNFFYKDKQVAVQELKRVIDAYLGVNYDVTRYEDLWELGYLPIHIKAIKEGTLVPYGIPMMTIENTLPGFQWLTNYLETVISCELWQIMTSATTSVAFYRTFKDAFERTGVDTNLVPFFGHDFSFRGMPGRHAAAMSGFGHLAAGFVGTDTIPAITFAEKYYNADVDVELVGCSVPACYDEETEVLTEDGFVMFRDLKEGVKVAYYLDNGEVDFTVPTEYYDLPYKGKMIKWTSSGYKYVDLLVTPNHKMVRISKKKGVSLFEAGDHSYQNRAGYSQRNHLPISGITVKRGLASLTPEERLKVAFQADGSFPNRAESYKSGQVRFSLKKERKKERLIWILEQTGYTYTVSEKDSRGYYSFWVNPKSNPDHFVKDFSWVGLDRPAEWYSDFINELAHWDGHKKSNVTLYSSTVKSCVSKVQEICAISGKKAQVRDYLDKRGNRQTIYTVCIQDKQSVSGGSIKREEVEYDGRVYCVSVPTKMLIVRRNGRVAVCGNTEHSTMTSSILYKAAQDATIDLSQAEKETFEELLDKVPTGIVSVVSDSFDFWNVVENILPQLKDKIMSRNGKLVVRPDSGCPVDVLCGQYYFKEIKADSFAGFLVLCKEDMLENHCFGSVYKFENYYYNVRCGFHKTEYGLPVETDDAVVEWGQYYPKPEELGLVEMLYNIFGGTVTDKGYKLLDEHIGAIYGDSITHDRCVEICKRLEKKGFCPTVVLGIGSYTFQHVTRDTHSFAVKATNVTVVKDGVAQELAIYKEPKTDSKKKSAKGLLRVVQDSEGSLQLINEANREELDDSLLQDVFLDGYLMNKTSLSEIRELIKSQL